MMSFFFTLILFLSALDFYGSMHQWRKHLFDTIVLRHKTLASPLNTIKNICTGEDKKTQPMTKTLLNLSCDSLLTWRSHGSWESPCATEDYRRRYPLRYYRVTLECRLDIGFVSPIPLEPIRWTFFR